VDVAAVLVVAVLAVAAGREAMSPAPQAPLLPELKHETERYLARFDHMDAHQRASAALSFRINQYRTMGASYPRALEAACYWATVRRAA
jgi:hypothetical protein